MDLTESIISSLRDVLGDGIVPLHEPKLGDREMNYVQECIRSSYVSSVGSFVDLFERTLSEIIGVKRVVATVNGTAALQVALRIGGVKQGDEVIMPSLTFVATANAAIYLGATPHFVDCSENTLGIDPRALREWLSYTAERTGGECRNRFTGRRIKALVPMHTFGHPCEIEDIVELAEDYCITVVEDAAESLGSLYNGRHTGTFGQSGAFSFNGNKIITTGGGGAIVTNDDNLANYAKHLTTTAKLAHPWEYVHDEIGYNFRMPNINAALGCAQLESLNSFIESKRRLYCRYSKKLSSIKGVKIMQEPSGCRSNYWLQTLVFDKSVSEFRDDVLKRSNELGIMTRPAWRLLHTLQPYVASPRSPLPITESLAERLINIPSSAGIA